MTSELTNRQYSQTPEFVKMCEKHGVIPTRRQAAKYRRGFGILREKTSLKSVAVK
jgi:hypothetical protein